MQSSELRSFVRDIEKPPVKRVTFNGGHSADFGLHAMAAFLAVSYSDLPIVWSTVWLWVEPIRTRRKPPGRVSTEGQILSVRIQIVWWFGAFQTAGRRLVTNSTFGGT